MKGLLIIYLLFIQMSLSAQSISGFVKNEKGEALIGATIIEKTSSRATRTNANGYYSLDLLKGKIQIMVKYIGYVSEEKNLTLTQYDLELDFILKEDVLMEQTLLVEASRMNNSGPKTTENINEFQGNPPLDVPVLLNQAQSLTYTSDAGNGVGYTGLRIRGMDATRINVTVNGIPINDQESQGVFWVNMPDLVSSTNNIQIQRGVGTSTNGGQAFGASVNLETDLFDQKAGASIGSAFGSFNTYKVNSQFSTGLLSNNWSFQGRLSKMGSDGYVDRASSDLKSYYFAAGHLGKKSSLRFTAFSGKELTYQSWNGVSEALLETDRTSNVYTYQNQIDNYQQDHFQLHYDLRPLAEKIPELKLSAALHYTRGHGYYEEYLENQDFSSYGLNPINFDTSAINQTDLVRQRWLANDFLGGVYAMVYKKELEAKKFYKVTFGGNYNHYYGAHFGEVIWARYASQSEINHRYYENDAFKRNWNNYLKLAYNTIKMSALAEIQARSVHYEFEGIDDNLSAINHSVDYLFLNPKMSLTYQLDEKKKHLTYGYFGISNREPLRNDFVEVEPKNWPKHETVYNFEAGYEYSSKKLLLTANLYYMQFKNQLVLNGELNDVGAYLRVNVPNSFRRGVELSGTWSALNKLSLNGNITLSQNQIEKFTNFLELYDANFNWLGQEKESYSNTSISFSPQVIGFAAAHYRPVESLDISLQTKYVGKQYLDNTSNESRQLNAYHTSDILISYSLKTNKWFKSIDINAMCYNVFDQLYESNGWTWSYNYNGDRINDNYYYPQAGRNFMIAVVANF